MDKKTKGFVYPIIAVVAFLVFQALVSVVILVTTIFSDTQGFREIMAQGNPMALVSGEAMAWTTIVSGILTVVALGLFKAFDWKKVLDVKSIDWKMSFVAILASIIGIFGLNIIEEWIDLPNLIEDIFTDMSSTVIGFTAIGIAAPIAEEFVFREGVAGNMFRAGFNKWAVILISAFIFGAIHGNPAQVPFAAAMGVVLAIIYYKTGNIVVPIILHILNNTAACIQTNVLGEEAKDYSMIQDMGGLAIALPVALVCIGICVVLLRVFWKKYQTS